MKFLVDENMPLSFAEILRELGYEAIHVLNTNLREALNAGAMVTITGQNIRVKRLPVQE